MKCAIMVSMFYTGYTPRAPFRTTAYREEEKLHEKNITVVARPPLHHTRFQRAHNLLHPPEGKGVPVW